MAHTSFPTDLPVPKDDGACAHLLNRTLPSLSLPATSGTQTDLSTLSGLTILFCYPRTGAPNEVVPDSWNAIPGARGCTPQACSFRDAIAPLKKLGVDNVFGMSTQDTAYQAEAKDRLHLPYELLSDESCAFVERLGLPTFEWEGKRVCKRLSMAVLDGKVVKVWYPVFPPDSNAQIVVEWLETEYKHR
ncbi:hypothetical protein B0A49_12394 [Cryomyces minteri]|uniref:Redoxin domain-containing protein n=1 Tax=Cryomyces minteri TaxID=331657 RepID=A0A4U0WFV4_9PEZI|nr:hypothetical protein B0A49_12394 [Cryomyces minteri]